MLVAAELGHAALEASLEVLRDPRAQGSRKGLEPKPILCQMNLAASYSGDTLVQLKNGIYFQRVLAVFSPGVVTTLI